MPTVQVIKHPNQRLDVATDKTITISNLDAPLQFEQFDLNVICLNDESFWMNERRRGYSEWVDAQPDIASLERLLDDASANVVLAFPSENIPYRYYPSSSSVELTPVLLKDMIPQALRIIRPLCDVKTFGLDIVYAKGITDLNGLHLTSQFYVKGYGDVLLNTAPPANKPTAIAVLSELVITTLPVLQSREILLSFAQIVLGDDEEAQECPSWFDHIPLMFDDQALDAEIVSQEAIIQAAEGRKSAAQTNREKNNRYKSVLYKTGNALENLVREMLGEIFDWDYKSFVDFHTSDFIIGVEDEWFVGEIKGENSNVRNTHLSQLSFNFDRDQEEGRIPTEGVFHKVLIANAWRKTEPGRREPVAQAQVEHATRYEILIVTSDVFLRLFECFKIGKLSAEKARALLSGTGILTVEDIEAGCNGE